MVGGLLWEDEGAVGEEKKGLLPWLSVIKAGACDPAVVWARRDKFGIHRPVVVAAEGEAVARVVIVTFSEGDDVRGFDDRSTIFEPDPQPTCRTLVFVSLDHDAPNPGRPPRRFIGCLGFLSKSLPGLKLR